MCRPRMSYRYDSEFLDFVDASGGRSARRFIELVAEKVLAAGGVGSVIDIGCGRGVWAAQWRRHGATRVLGVDGDYVSRDTLLIPRECFLAADLSKPLDAGARFELVQCLEVAEHLAPEAADILIDGLVRHGDLIIFSAAVPGQGGEHHVNERAYAYWRDMFVARDYQLYDSIRPLLRNESDVEPWYRYNTFVYANRSGAQRLTAQARSCLLTPTQAIPNVAPLAWRLRCRAISVLPQGIGNLGARVKHRLVNRIRAEHR
jgi:SAM-dependent methyltransferase